MTPVFYNNLIVMRRILFLAVVMLVFHMPATVIGQETDVLKGVEADPTATLVETDTEVCLGDSVAVYLFLTGNGPWDVVINDNSGEYLFLDNVKTATTTIWLAPTEDNVYYVASVKDRKRNSGQTFGEVAISVFLPTPVTILLEKTAYLQTDPSVELRSDPSGGIFFGNGVTGNRFFPSIATAEESPHLLTCTYTNAVGCTSSDEIVVHVLHGEGSVVLVSGGDTITSLCDFGKTYEIRGSNLDQIPGLFELREAGSQIPVEGHLTDKDLKDDRALLDPVGLAGTYELFYTYEFSGITVVKSSRFLVDDPGILEIPDIPEQVCNSDAPYPLVPNLAGEDPGAVYTFSGPGVTGNQADGFYYDPGDPEAPAGTHEITLNYASSNGCAYRMVLAVTKRVAPEVHFSMSNVCMPRGGGVITFENLTIDKSKVVGWLWDFGDPRSGADNFSYLENPVHFYGEGGPRQIKLNATTEEVCVGSYTLDTILSEKPAADLSWTNDCFVKGQKVKFMDRSTAVYTSLDTLVWTIRNQNGAILEETGTGSRADTVEYLFANQGTYLIDLYIKDGNGCEGDTTRELVLFPVTPLTAEGYDENFNGTGSSWSPGSQGQSHSWIRGIPDFNGFQQVQGDLAWYTDLPEADPGYVERSWIQSGCFDFSSLQSPVFQMELMKSFEPGMDGAVLQYQDVVSEGWKTIGQVGQGNHWYNAAELLLQPGGSNWGWGNMEPFVPDSKWLTAVHDLDVVSGLPHVKFRIAMATGGTRALGNQGFAVDDIVIGERIRRSLLEHFTNSSSMECRDADDVVDLFARSHPGTLIDIQYHVDYPGVDPMNENNPYPPSTRYFSYGIQGVPFAILNGGGNPGALYDFSDPSNEPNDNVLKQASLEIPIFDVDLSVDWEESRLEAHTVVTCRTETFHSNLQLYVVVIENLVTAFPGLNLDTSFRNVVLEMLPSPAGKLLGNSWYLGRTDTRTYAWDYAEYVEDIEELSVVAFVQDRDNETILQADVVRRTPGVGFPERGFEPGLLGVFPNPARDHLYVNFGSRNGLAGQLRIVDLSGRTVMQTEVTPGYTVQRLDIEHLSRGVYMIYWMESGRVRGRNKLVFSK